MQIYTSRAAHLGRYTRFGYSTYTLQYIYCGMYLSIITQIQRRRGSRALEGWTQLAFRIIVIIATLMLVCGAIAAVTFIFSLAFIRPLIAASRRGCQRLWRFSPACTYLPLCAALQRLARCGGSIAARHTLAAALLQGMRMSAMSLARHFRERRR